MGNNSNAVTMNALCQSNRLEGMTPTSERRLEKTLSNLIENSGPEYVVQVLKVLKAHSVNKLVDPLSTQEHQPGDPLISWSRKYDRPSHKTGLSEIYYTWPNPRQRIRAIGAMVQGIELETASSKQIEKFMNGVTSSYRTPDGNKIPIGADGFGEYRLNRLAANLSRRLNRQSAERFSAAHLTASVLPVGNYTVPIAGAKRTLGSFIKDYKSVNKEDAQNALSVLDQCAVGQVTTAPTYATKYWKRSVVSAVEESGGTVDNNLRVYLKSLKSDGVKSRPYEEYKFLGNDVDQYDQYVGTIGFIQQGGAKLRSVANVNRFVNFTLTPWAKALEDTFYSEPEIRVTDQNSAFGVIQQWIKEGREITSLDLTSATDLLDFRAMYDPIMQYAEDTGEDLLYDTCDYFSRVAQAPMFVPDLDGSIRFRTGQPLGAKGSFQTLTVMNYMAGKMAEERAGLRREGSLPNFLVVGDDFICDSRMATAYNDIISSWGGKTNIEKSMQSDQYGEFLSHIVTRDTVLKTKPRYRLGYDSIYINADKSTLKRISHYYRERREDKDALELYGLITDHSSKRGPHVGSPLRADLETRQVIERSRDLLSEFSKVGGSSDHVGLSTQTLELARDSSIEAQLDLVSEHFGAKPKYDHSMIPTVAALRESLHAANPDGAVLTIMPRRARRRIIEDTHKNSVLKGISDDIDSVQQSFNNVKLQLDRKRRELTSKSRDVKLLKDKMSEAHCIVEQSTDTLDAINRLIEFNRNEMAKIQDSQVSHRQQDDDQSDTSLLHTNKCGETRQSSKGPTPLMRAKFAALAEKLEIVRNGVHLDKGEFTTSIDKFDHVSGERVDRDAQKQLTTRESYRKQARDVAAIAQAYYGKGDTAIQTSSGTVSAETIAIGAMESPTLDLEELHKEGFQEKAYANPDPIDPMLVSEAVNTIVNMIKTGDIPALSNDSSTDDIESVEPENSDTVRIDESQFIVDSNQPQHLL